MSEQSSREKVLKKIRQALESSVPLPFDGHAKNETIFNNSTEDETVVFAENFSKLQGKFAFCTSLTDLKHQIKRLIDERGWNKIYCADSAILNILEGIFVPFQSLKDSNVSITGCEYLIARTGSIVLSSAQPNGRTSSVYSPVHICIAYNRQLVYDIKDALGFIVERYGDNLPSIITLASGPSRTADIEKTLVTGVHGPGEVFCFLMEDSPI
ncbi:MAG: LUD domain-containing protein [Ferruginibacter sp.]|nr:LUD domain-containing protein [Ferruginibacter sp.]